MAAAIAAAIDGGRDFNGGDHGDEVDDDVCRDNGNEDDGGNEDGDGDENGEGVGVDKGSKSSE